MEAYSSCLKTPYFLDQGLRGVAANVCVRVCVCVFLFVCLFVCFFFRGGDYLKTVIFIKRMIK